ncbi:MAG: hypothetical protein R3C19_07800 [Planctomycetaceae bacterium]
MRNTAIFALLLFLSPTIAVAHPGHGYAATQDGVLHYVVNPVHATPWILGAMALAVACRLVIVRRNRRKKCTGKATKPLQSK